MLVRLLVCLYVFLVCSRHPPLDISCCSKRFPLLVSVVVLQWLAPRARFVDGGFSLPPSHTAPVLGTVRATFARAAPPTGCLVAMLPCLNPPLVGVMLIRYISTVYIRCSDSLSSPAGPPPMLAPRSTWAACACGWTTLEERMVVVKTFCSLLSFGVKQSQLFSLSGCGERKGSWSWT